jgi:transposase
MKPAPDSRYRHRFISHAVWLYNVFRLNLRDVELLLAERGIVVSYETMRRWCRKFGQSFAKAMRRRVGFFLTAVRCGTRPGGADHLLPAVADDTPIVNRAITVSSSRWLRLAKRRRSRCEPQLYGARHLIESFNPKLKRFRPITTRYEKTARKALAARRLVASVVWLN